jgi:hypothetical protein
MIARQKVTDATSDSGLSAESSSAEQAMIADQANIPSLPASANDSGRRLRNVLILANIAGWIIILGLIKLIFF